MQVNSFFSFSKWQNPIKILLFLSVLWLTYLIIKEKGENWLTIKAQFLVLKSTTNRLLLALIIVLTPLNWAFEAWKWQFLAKKIEELSFLDAYKGVLAGLALSTTTPFMAGDYAAKIWLLKADNRKESFGAILLCNTMQLYVSLLFGAVSYGYFILTQNPTYFWFHTLFLFSLILALFVGIILAINTHWLSYLTNNFKRLKKYVEIIEKYNSKEILLAFILSILRYLVFSFQFVLMFFIFNINLSFLTFFCGVGMIFLAKTIVPFINFASDFGVRQLASFYYFNFYHISPSAILAATTFIWFINILLPLLVGSIFIFKFKFINKISQE